MQSGLLQFAAADAGGRRPAARWMARLAALAAAVCLFALTGCDENRIAELEEGVATETDVRARFGEPEQVWTAADMAGLPLEGAAALAAAPGARTFEYNRQPEGRVNYMITVGADGRMSALRQVLTPQVFARVQPGMSMEQVRKLLGKPAKITPFALKRQTAYDWRYMDGSRGLVFTALFDQDLRVVSTASVDDDTASPRR